MSLCYDFQKWTMIILSSVAVSLTIGLVSPVYGQTTTMSPEEAEERIQEIGKKVQEFETILNYCYEHASDSANPVQDLIDKGLLNYKYKSGITCGEIKPVYDNIMGILRNMSASGLIEIK